jgi:hypothetical protein
MVLIMERTFLTPFTSLKNATYGKGQIWPQFK